MQMRLLSPALAAGVVVSLCATVSAHRMDEYLQAARIGIDPARVELQLDLTPGIAIVDTVIASIDRDRDGVLSGTEKDAYAAAIVGDVDLGIDSRPLALGDIDATFPELDTLRRGEGVIRLRASADLPALKHGAHALSFQNRHRSDVGVYLANALVPSTDRIAIHAQRRDQAQTDLTIEYTLRGAPVNVPSKAAALVVFAAAGGLALLLARLSA